MRLIVLLLLGSFPFLLFANSRTVMCDENKVISIYLRPNFSTIVNFPVKPDNVLLGGSKQFAIEYIKNDIALSVLSSSASTNMFVYLFGRRCSFLLTTGANKYDSLVKVRDPDENKIRIQFRE